MSNRRVLRYRSDNGAHVAIAGPAGRIYTHMAMIDVPVRMIKVPNGDVERYTSTIENAPRPKIACRQMLTIGKQLGITKAAKKFLRGCES